MTKEERDNLRAEAAMRVLAELNAHHALSSVENKNAELARRMTEARRLRVQHACNEADALILELEAREEATPDAPPSKAEIVAAGIAAGGQILLCKHGRTSFEDCEHCDAEDAAGKSGTAGEEGAQPA